jgi:hypothetical protein
MIRCVQFEVTEKGLLQFQTVLIMVARYAELSETVQRVHHYPIQTIMLQNIITHLKAQSFLPCTSDYLAIDETMPVVEKLLAESRRRPPAERSSEEFQANLATLCQDTQQLEEVVWNTQTQLANAQSLAAWATLAAPQGQEE